MLLRGGGKKQRWSFFFLGDQAGDRERGQRAFVWLFWGERVWSLREEKVAGTGVLGAEAASFQEGERFPQAGHREKGLFLFWEEPAKEGIFAGKLKARGDT